MSRRQGASPVVTAYGQWRSPISAARLASAGHTVSGARYVGTEIWWLEKQPNRGGRYAVRRRADVGDDGNGTADVVPPPWNVRSRVHEYGGGAWTVDDRGRLVFVEFTDQRLYRLDTPGGVPVALTPPPPTPAAWRYGELQVVGHEVWCVRERHDDAGRVRRDLAAVPLDGSASTDEGAVRSVLGGTAFLAGARVSPDGNHVAWVAWEHPQMPWDGTWLRVAEIGPDGVARTHRTLLGSTTVSVLQPEWDGPDALLAASDADGFWNLVRVPIDGGAVRPLAPTAAETGGPLWMLGSRWFAGCPGSPTTDLLATRTFGSTLLARRDRATGDWHEFDLGDHTTVSLLDVRPGRALLLTLGARTPAGLRELSFDGGHTPSLRDVRLSVDYIPDESYLPVVEQTVITASDGRVVHAVLYHPRNPLHRGPADERPPFVALVHGGPTAHASPELSLVIAYYTSRGIGVVDVDYGGSTGWGRAYRERLRGGWGVVEVEDVETVVRDLVAHGIADPARLAIEGGSAGGWTVLASLTSNTLFACGTSFYGIADLEAFAAHTHDFESHYLDGLVGPLPQAAHVRRDRSPINRVDRLNSPVLLLQGLDDPIVTPDQADSFREALLAKGVRHAQVSYVGESHGFRRAATVKHSREAALSFYGQVMGFAPPDVPELALGQSITFPP